MEQHDGSFLTALLVMLSVLIGGCATTPAEVEPQVVPAAVAKPAPTPKPAPATAPEPVVPRVAILLTDGKPAYRNVAGELANRFDDPSIYNLADPGLSGAVAMRIIADTPTDVVVAIGLPAARAATKGSEIPVVFCQVFNFNDHQLVSHRSKGVASIPPLDQQIAAWKRLDPELGHIGAIVGTGHDALMTQAAEAAQQHEVKLHHRTASSDRETLYLFNQLLPHIDGFWLFPDNRVLSPAVLRQMLDYASRHRVQVAVFNESLLKLGATISATTNASDIASRIVSLVDLFVSDSADSIPDITPLTEVTIRTNDAVLQELGLSAADVQSVARTEDAR